MLKRLVYVIVLALLPLKAVAAMPQNSFLIAPVHSAKELLQQVRAHKLEARYAQALSLPVSEIDMLLARVELIHAPRETRVKMYFYHAGTGKMGWRMRTIHRGDGVFVLPSGAPLLYQACGNIIFDAATPASYNKHILAPPQFAQPDYMIGMQGSELPGVIEDRIASASDLQYGIPDVTAGAGTEGLPIVGDVVGAPEIASNIPSLTADILPETPVVSQEAGIAAALHAAGAGGGNSLAYLLGGLGAAGLLGDLLSQGGSSTAPALTPGNTGKPLPPITPPATVPESDGVIALSLGLVLLGGWLRIRASRVQTY